MSVLSGAPLATSLASCVAHAHLGVEPTPSHLPAGWPAVLPPLY